MKSLKTILLSVVVASTVTACGHSSQSGNWSGATTLKTANPTPQGQSDATPLPATGRPADSWQTTCGNIDGVDKGKYCFHQTGPNPQYTIWFFHGVMDSEKVFLKSMLNQDSFIEFEKGLPAVNIVTVSYGWSWMLTAYPNRTKRPVDATVNVFTSEIVPFIENKFNPAKPYVAMGQSEGGNSVATICAAAPELWHSCVLVNPLLPACDPFALTNCNNSGVNLLVHATYTQDTWENTQPMALMKNTYKLPKSFVTACADDQYKLFDGPKAWADQANQLGYSAQWDPVMSNCDHLHWPAQDVLSFLGQ